MSRLLGLTALLCTVLLGGLQPAPAQDNPVSFRRDIAPIILDNCLACHGPKKAEGGYRVDTFERLVAAGDSGTAGFTPANADGSEAFRRIITDDPSERMPLEGDPIPPDQVEVLRRWIEQGAKYDGEDPKASLSSIVPPLVYPRGPETYPYAIPVTALAWSADGQELFASGYHEITVWNGQSGSLVRRIHNVGQRTLAMAVSADGQLLAAAGGTPGKLGETRIYAATTGELKTVVPSMSDVVLDLAFHPQGDRLAIAGADNILRIVDVASGKDLRTITSHSDWVTAVAWNSDGSKLASASRDKTVKVFDVNTGELLTTYSGHGTAVRGVAFHPDGAEVYSGGEDNKLHRWAIAEAKKVGETAFGGKVYKLAVAGEFLFATSEDKTVRQFQAKDQQLVREYAGHKDWTLSVAPHPATKRLATGGFDGEVRIWNTETGELVVAFLAAPGYQAK